MGWGSLNERNSKKTGEEVVLISVGTYVIDQLSESV